MVSMQSDQMFDISTSGGEERSSSILTSPTTILSDSPTTGVTALEVGLFDDVTIGKWNGG